MCDHDYRGTFPVEPDEQVHYLAAHAAVKIARRLVGEEYVRMCDHCPGNGSPLTLSSGQLGSMVFRRTLRRFGAWSQSEKISAQGRITLPQEYRDHAGLVPGGDVMVVGNEIGVEIWSRERWLEEQKMIMEHEREKGEREMESDLDTGRGI